jgi:hypothetical protein
VRPTVTLDIPAGGIWVYFVCFVPAKTVFLTNVRTFVLSESSDLTIMCMFVLSDGWDLTIVRIIVKKTAEETGTHHCFTLRIRK